MLARDRAPAEVKVVLSIAVRVVVRGSKRLRAQWCRVAIDPKPRNDRTRSMESGMACQVRFLGPLNGYHGEQGCSRLGPNDEPGPLHDESLARRWAGLGWQHRHCHLPAWLERHRARETAADLGWQMHDHGLEVEWAWIRPPSCIGRGVRAAFSASGTLGCTSGKAPMRVAGPTRGARARSQLVPRRLMTPLS